MRVTTAFNRVLRLPGASVTSVSFGPQGVIVGVRLRAKRLICPWCGFSTGSRYDSRQRSWRHLDLASTKLTLSGEIRRLWCRDCEAVVTEDIPWARPASRYTTDFEDVAAWLCQRVDKTTVSTLLRCSWRSVDAIVNRVVDEMIDDTRLDDLYRIGVDEIAYKRGHNYLTIVADHDTGNVVHVGEGKGKDALEGFFDELGEQRAQQIEAVSMDFGSAYRSVVQDKCPDADICLDPFHTIQLANRALDAVYKNSRHGVDQFISGREWQRARVALRVGAERLTDKQASALSTVTRYRQLGRAYELKEQLRDLYRIVHTQDARDYLKAWVTSALRSRIPAFKILAKQIRKHFDGIVAAIELGLANTRLEGINSHIRVIQRRSHGLTSVKSLTSMIYLCLGGITVDLPT